MAGILIASLGALLFIAAGIMWLMPSKRAKAKYVQAPAVVMILVGVVMTNMAQREQLDAAGFVNREDQAAAAEEGIEDGETWYALISEREEEARAAERSECRADFTCWGRDRRIDAEVRCKREIENAARYAHEWTDDWTSPMFSRFAWEDEEAGVMTYYGDRLRFQNGFGAWSNMVYACHYDTERDIAVSIEVSEGRL